MSFWKFIWAAVWREAGVMARVVQTVTVSIPALMALIVSISGGEWTKDVWPAWVWLLLTLIALVGTFVYGVTKRAFVLEKDLVPKILISEPQEDFMPWPEAQQGKRVNRHYFLAIKNESLSNIHNCSVQDMGFVNNRGHEAPAKGRYMRLRTERSANPQLHTYTRRFDLRGCGTSVEVDVCSMDEGKEDSRVIMYYATTPTEQYGNAIKRELFPHFLTIEVTADELMKPIQQTFKIFISSNGDLKMEAISGAR